MDAKNLLIHCVDILDGFDMESQSVDAHVEVYFEDKDSIIIPDKTFIVEVFSGCIRFKKVFDVVIREFYKQEGRVILSSLENLFRSLCYICLFRLDEVGIVAFKTLLETQKLHLMHKFLSFLSNENSVETWMKDAWYKLYDPVFVENEILEPLLRNLPDLQEIVSEMKDKMDNKNKKPIQKIPPTQPKPFHLTITRARSVPMPELISVMGKPQPVPDSTYIEPRERQQLTQIKVDNRRRAEDLMKEANENEPKTLTRKGKKKSPDENNASSSKKEFPTSGINRMKPRAVPNFASQEIPIKLNTAAILREWKLYKEAENRDLKKLKDLEAGAFSLDAFQQWQNSIRDADLASQIAEVERRRLAGLLSREEAILAKKRLEEENREIVEEMRRIMAQKRLEFEKERAIQNEQIKAMVEKVLATHDQAKQAVKSIQEDKQKLVKELQAEANERQELALAEAEAELRKKVSIINEIRAIEATTPARGGGANLANDRPVDLASTVGHGLLLEMSILELRERLMMLKEKEIYNYEKKRDAIIDAKQLKDERLMQSLQEIGQHRAKKTKEAAEVQANRMKPTKDLLQRHLNSQQQAELDQLREKLNVRRQERMEIQSGQSQKNNRIKPLPNLQKQSENQWKELDKSKENRVKMASEYGKGSLVAKLDFLST